MINSSIFKSYDIRGIYPQELNEDAAYKIGRAFVEHTGAKRVVMGYDARLSSPALLGALAAGVLSRGAEASTLGRVPTECLYFTVASYEFDAGIMITASHNPKEYNGFKMMKREGDGMSMIRGKDLLPAIGEGDFNGGNPRIEERDIWQDYLNHILKFSSGNPPVGGKPFKIVVDASNGVIGKAIKLVKDKLPIEITELNFEPNGNFPNHSPNPLVEGSSNQIRDKIKEVGADFGFMFDGDADRVFLVDENGKLISSDATLLLLAKYFLDKYPGSAIAYAAICSKAVPEFVKKWGGVPIRSAVGFVNTREALMKNNGAMGGELSGHYCFRDHFYADSGMIAFLTLLQIISQDGRKVSEITKELSPYFKSAESNFQVADKDAVLNKIKEKYSDAPQDFLDGITVEYNDWWFNARPSNTEPVLRLTVEANTRELLEQKKQELSELIVNK